MTAEEAKEAVFGEIATWDGYVTAIEPVSGLAFITVKSDAQPTESEALRVLAVALKSWLENTMKDFARPVVCVRMFPEAMQIDGGWVAASRLLVTEGYRDAETRRERAERMFQCHRGFGSFERKDEPISQSRGIPVSDQPVVGMTQ